MVTQAYSYAPGVRLYADSSASASALSRVSTEMPSLGGEHLQRFHHVEIAH